MTEPNYHTPISLLVPSRGRPTRLADMWATARATSIHPELMELVVYADDDDRSMGDYDFDSWPGNMTFIRGPRILLSETWNRCAEKAQGGILWHGNDDVLFRSLRWDMEIRDAFRAWPDRIGCVHGRDGIHDGAMATLGFYSRQWVDTLGYFCPPYFSSDYNDTWLSNVADMTGRRQFLPNVYTEHMHPAVGKGPTDLTHTERLTRHRQDNVDALYASLAHKRDEDAGKLRAAIAEAAA